MTNSPILQTAPSMQSILFLYVVRSPYVMASQHWTFYTWTYFNTQSTILALNESLAYLDIGPWKQTILPFWVELVQYSNNQNSFFYHFPCFEKAHTQKQNLHKSKIFVILLLF